MMDDLKARAMAAAKEARDRGATREQIESVVAQIMGSAGQPTMPQMPVRPDASDTSRQGQGISDMQAMGQMVANTAATPMQVIPGAEAVQAGARSLVRGQSYREARGDIQEAKLPAAMALPLQAPVIGGLLRPAAANVPRAVQAAARLTRTPAKAGATYGAASQALSADPDISIGERATRTGVGAVVGAVAGKVPDVASVYGRAWFSRRGSPDQMAVQAKEKLDQVAGKLYERAAAEAAASPTRLAVVGNLLARPTIKPYTDAVRSSDKFAAADDPTVVREVYRQLSDAERALRRALKSDPAKANEIRRELTDVVTAKREVTAVTDQIMPTFSKANAVYAAGMRRIEAMGEGVAAALRVFGQTPTGRNTLTKGRAAYEQRFSRMKPADRNAAVQAFLAETRNRTNPALNFNLFRSLTGPIRATRAADFLRNAGDETQLLTDYLVKAGIVGGTGQR